MELRWKRLAVYFVIVLLSYVYANEKKEAVSAREGGTVTLQTTEAICQNSIKIAWMYGPESPTKRIVTLKNTMVKSDYEDHFKNRLQLDHETGALTLYNVRVSDSGVYMCQSFGTSILSQHVHLVVYSPIDSPNIKINVSLINTDCSSVTVECWIENSRELKLSWYRGRTILKSTNSAVMSLRLNLPLEINSYDGDSYSCVAQNPVEEKATKFLKEETCLKDGDTNWCQTEATVRLVISAVVGMALIVIVVDHIRLRR